MWKKCIALWTTCIFLAATLLGCAGEPPAAPVVLTVAGGWPDCRALDLVARAFMDEYPNCTIVYEYVQDYYASLAKRMVGDDAIDLFFTTNIQPGNTLQPYTLDLYDLEGLDLSHTFDGLIQNFLYRSDTQETQLYALPLGAEMRGMFVNKTLLDSLGIALPTNQETLLSACATLKANGYIPFHGNPGAFAQVLVYPWICNLIANADDSKAVYDAINARKPGVGELFREPIEFLYRLVAEGFYDYKKAQTDLNLFTDAADEAYARDFLHIAQQGDEWIKTSDVGQVAFMPSPMSLGSVIAKTKDDYHSEIEYVFMLAPIGKDGGFAYLSPAHGIAICKNAKQKEWAIRFLDFLFQPEYNARFAEAFNVIPNTVEAFSYIRSAFDVPDARISHLGEVTFDYGFYDAILPVLVNASKANNPKYMLDDGNGNLSMVPLETFMEELENSLQQA